MSVRDGRDAAACGAWEEAYALLMKSDAGGLAAPGDLALLGQVAYAAGHLDVAVEAWERAHALCAQAGDRVPAAGAAGPGPNRLLFGNPLDGPGRGGLPRAD